MRGGVDYGPAYLEDLVEPALEPDPPRHGKGWKITQWVCIALSALMVLGSLSVYGVYRNAWGNIEEIPDEGRTKEALRPPKLNNAMNILIMGSDTREGANKKYGSSGGERSDTTILLHLSAGGERAIGLSFPRDAMVNIPECKKNGQVYPAHFGQINGAYANAGPVCTVNTIESITKIRVDHYIKVDFTGFKAIVNALGGVEICSPKAFEDPKAKLVIKKAGRQKINGETALGWVRTRYKLGDGTDIGRIERQQQFMSSVVTKALSQGVLTSPTKLTKFVSAVSKSLATDKDFNQKAMLDLAGKLKGMDLKKIKFQTVPWRYATTAERAAHKDWNGRVFFQEGKAAALFEAIAQDNKAPAAQPKTQNVATTAKPVPAAQIKVKVYNGTQQQGLAGRTVDSLIARKYMASLGSTNTFGAGNLAKTVIKYGPGAEAHAAQVAAMIPGVQPAPSAQATPGTVFLYLGADYSGLSSTGPVAIPKVDREIKATDNICKKTVLGS